MPEFVMEGRDHAARAESAFVLRFIEALFFTESDSCYDAEEWFSDEAREARESGQCGELPCDVGYADLHPDSLAAIRADCEAWQTENAALLALAYGYDDYDESAAGRDYWYTRNGHGVGFWDRGLGDVGDKLTDTCQYRDVQTWFGDHITYGNAPFVHVSL